MNRLLLLAVVCAAAGMGSGLPSLSAQTAGVVISEFRARGPLGGNDEFIELYNDGGAAVDLSGWKIRGSNASGTISTRATIAPSTVLKPGCHFLVTNTASNGYSGPVPGDQTYSTGITDDGGIALTLPNDTVVDQAGLSAGSAFKEGTSLARFTSVNFDRSYERRAGIGTRYQDTQDNAADFVLISPSIPQGRSSCEPLGVGAASPAALDAGATTTLTVKVTPATFPTSTDLRVTVDLTAIGGDAAQTFLDDGTNGDAIAGDNTFTFVAIVAPGISPGPRTLPATISDAQGRSGTATITVVVQQPPTPIHAIQGREATSPLVGVHVTTTGIVTAIVNNGFFIQTPDADADSDPFTSEGLFVFTSTMPTVGVAQRVSVSGAVVEFQPAGPGTPSTTELGGGSVSALLSSGHPLPTPATLVRDDTPPGRALPDLERYEGMRVTGDFQVVSPTDAFSLTAAQERNADPGTSTGEFHVVVRGIDRPLRERGLEPGQALPPGAPSGVERFDGNPERLRVDGDGQIGGIRFDVAAGQVLNGFTGVLEFSFGSWALLPDPASIPACANVDVCGAAARAVPAPAEGEFTIASFNMERFFDTVEDPDTSDVALTPLAFERRLAKVSATVRNILSLPDILGAVEVETLGALEAIAERINADAAATTGTSPQYVAFLEEGNDPGGIDVGFLVKTSRVSVVNVQLVGKDATYTQPDGAVVLLNDRPPLVLDARVQGPLGDPYPVTVVVNHLRSLSGIDGADGARVRAKRLAQAEFLATEIQRRQTADPRARIVAVGDFNAFQFDDGYADVLGTIRGVPADPHTVVLSGPDLVDPDLSNLVQDLAPPSERYSFVFDGNAQALDHVIVSNAMRKRATRLVFSRSNADFPESLRRDANRPERVSDHDAPVAYFAFPSAPIVSLNGDSIVTIEAYTGSYAEPGADAHDEDGPLAVDISGTVDVNRPGTYEITYTATNGYLRSSITRTVRVEDRTAPAINFFSLSPDTLWAPNHKMVDVTAIYAVAEASQAASCALTAVSDQPDDGRGDGHTSDDVVIVDAQRLRLRAERAAPAPARTYTVTLTCEDPSSNRTTASGVVRVAR